MSDVSSGKALENFTVNRFVKFLEEKIISDNEYGLRNKRLRLTSLMGFSRDIYGNWKKDISKDVL